MLFLFMELELAIIKPVVFWQTNSAQHNINNKGYVL